MTSAVRKRSATGSSSFVVRWLASVAASAVVALATPGTAFAQGKSQEHRNNPPPSRSELIPAASAPAVSAGGATPFAWIDDASLVEPGAASLAVSIARWHGNDSSEVDVPILDLSVGLASRVHIAATIPRVVGSGDGSGAVSGMGTSYFSVKIAAIDNPKRKVKLSVAPTLELLGRGVVQSGTSSERRTHFGLPVSVELNRGGPRIYAGAGYFSRGVWFAGAGTGARATSRTYVSAAYSRSWRRMTAADLASTERSRNEVSGSVAFELRSNISAFGTVARTIATTAENGAGTTVSGGLSVFVPRSSK